MRMFDIEIETGNSMGGITRSKRRLLSKEALIQRIEYILDALEGDLNKFTVTIKGPESQP